MRVGIGLAEHRYRAVWLIISAVLCQGSLGFRENDGQMEGEIWKESGGIREIKASDLEQGNCVRGQTPVRLHSTGKQEQYGLVGGHGVVAKAYNGQSLWQVFSPSAPPST